MELKEEWRPVKGYENIIEVSNLGRVRSISRYEKTGNKGRKFVRGKILKCEKMAKGYIRIKPTRRLGGKRFLVHRLIAETFIPNPNNYPVVNHKDEDKSNNKVENLEWCTPRYNSKYGTCQQRRSIYRKRAVEMIDKNTKEVIEIFDSMKSAEEKTHISAKQISAVCRGYDKSARGYYWRYANGNERS